jgi:hypothetical protein
MPVLALGLYCQLTDLSSRPSADLTGFLGASFPPAFDLALSSFRKSDQQTKPLMEPSSKTTSTPSCSLAHHTHLSHFTDCTLTIDGPFQSKLRDIDNPAKRGGGIVREGLQNRGKGLFCCEESLRDQLVGDSQKEPRCELTLRARGLSGQPPHDLVVRLR